MLRKMHECEFLLYRKLTRYHGDLVKKEFIIRKFGSKTKSVKMMSSSNTVPVQAKMAFSFIQFL
jgi:hypothetical protein